MNVACGNLRFSAIAKTVLALIAGIAWGDVSTRERMVVSSQEVFGKLMQKSSDPTLLKFDVLARIAELPDGTLDQEQLKRLIRLLRPDREGKLLLAAATATSSLLYLRNA